MYVQHVQPYFNINSTLAANTAGMQPDMRSMFFSNGNGGVLPDYQQTPRNHTLNTTNGPDSISSFAVSQSALIGHTPYSTPQPTTTTTGAPRTPPSATRSRGGNPNKPERSNWRIVKADDERIANYVMQYGAQRVHGIKAHQVPGCKCFTDSSKRRRFGRGPVCGIRSPAKDRSRLPEYLSSLSRSRPSVSPGNSTEFMCPNCGLKCTQWQSVKTHFPTCVLKWGNPYGQSWYDHTSLCITGQQGNRSTP